MCSLRKFSELYYIARLNADPQKRDEYLMKQRLRRKKTEVAKTCETRYAIIQHETRCRCDIKLYELKYREK